ncbi:MAG: 4-(cytidine 5'-diphospho)-2-C-methyl-D-erythritol kinase [Nibricoccus sp.]
MSAVTVFSPAKLNLSLAITGRRPDGFHDLVSVVAPVKFGDTLRVERAENAEFTLECNDSAVPLDDTNLILKAAKLFRAATGAGFGARFVLEKRIPIGAGLGGGSSNAVAALRALNQLTSQPLGDDQLLALATQLGSDCALFLHGTPVVMRGRGERVETLASSARARLSGRRVLLFKPSFGIATAWAYGQMIASAPESYLPAERAEEHLAKWLSGDAPVESLLFNNMEAVAFRKYLALPTLLEQLREKFGLGVAMSGSGSACFALLREETPVEAVRELVAKAWGRHTFISDTEIV